MTLKLYNTRTRRKDVFEPIDPEGCADVCLRAYGL